MKNYILYTSLFVFMFSGFLYSQDSYEMSKKLYSKNWKTKEGDNTKKWIDSKKRLESIEENKTQRKYHSSHFMNSRNTSRGNYPNVSDFEKGNLKSNVSSKVNSTKLDPLRIRQSVSSKPKGRTPRNAKKDKLFSKKIE
jgi:hypothetical protein